MNDLQQADETVFGFPQWQSLTVTPSNKTKRKSETNQGQILLPLTPIARGRCGFFTPPIAR
jgi:hypothetical protein